MNSAGGSPAKVVALVVSELEHDNFTDMVDASRCPPDHNVAYQTP